MAVASSFSVAPSLLRRPPPSSDSGSLAAASGLVAPAVKPSSGSFFSVPDVMSRAVRRWKRLVVAISGSGAAVAAVDPPAKASSSPTSHESSDDGRPFNYSSPPPFTIAEVRAAIPKRCWEKDAWRSLSYVIWDLAVVLSLAAAAAFFDSWLLWPLYWFAQGTMFWALFVLGHDCGHGSFSDSKSLNDFIGHVTHTAILVPFHGWRISHRTHHQNHGHVENDESWYPLTESLYRELDPVAKMSRFSPLSMLAYPIYLWRRSPGKFGSHFNPDSPLFQPSERNDVITSTTCWFAMISFLIGATIVAGPLWMFKLYFVPYLVNVIWLDFVTYLHHHGHEDKIPWYRGPEWSYLRGGLSTIDRDYGMFNHIQHDIGTHVVHHLFPQIPHYNLIEATAGARHVLGKFYRVPEKSGPFPFHLVRIYLKSLSRDHYVKDHGNILFYECDNPEAVKT